MKNRLISIKRIIEKEVGHRLDTKSRKRIHTYARSIYCQIAREMSGPRPYSLAEIGEVIRRDHASVLHNINVIFPFAIQETSFKVLYLTMKAMFVDSAGEDNFDEVKTLADKVLKLEKQNNALNQKLDLLRFGSNKFETLLSGLSNDEVEEIYDKITIMVKAIKNRVYL